MEFAEGTKNCENISLPVGLRWRCHLHYYDSQITEFITLDGSTLYTVRDATLCDIVGKMQDQPRQFVAKEDAK